MLVIFIFIKNKDTVISKAYLIITNCTGRKRLGRPALQFSDLNLTGSASSVAAHWVASLKQSTRDYTACEFYAGRGFSEVLKTANYLGASTAIVSAGLGLIPGESKIPSYDLTVTEGQNNVLNKLNSTQRTSKIWWQALHKELGVSAPFEKMLNEHPKKIILIALPSTYLAMVEHELLSLSPSLMGRLRIFTSELGQRSLPIELQKQVMPYDERLETTTHTGTRSDFPQRALRHFVMQLHAESLSTCEASTSVTESLKNQQRRVVPVRVKKTDQEIIDCLCTNWDAYCGASGRLLRCLRDDLGVACEQSRFRMLWKQAQEIKSRRGN